MSEFKVGDKVNIYCATLEPRLTAVGVIKSFANHDLAQVEYVLITEYKHLKWFHVKQLELIERPKPKVKLYQWVVSEHASSLLKTQAPFIPVYMFKDEQALRENYNNRKFKWVKRLDHTMIEVDDE